MPRLGSLSQFQSQVTTTRNCSTWYLYGMLQVVPTVIQHLFLDLRCVSVKHTSLPYSKNNFPNMSLTKANANYWIEEIPFNLPYTKPSHGESFIDKFFGIKKRGVVKVIHVSHADKVKLRTARLGKTNQITRVRSTASVRSISSDTGKGGPCEGGRCLSSRTTHYPRAKAEHPTETQRRV